MWSGGKDATLALDTLHSQSPRRIDGLLTTVTEEDETVTAHGTPLPFIGRQAECLGIPLHVLRLPREASNDTYEARLKEALRPLLETGLRAVVAGDLFLEDVKKYRERVLTASGARPLFPLWKRDTTWLAHHFLDRGYRAIVTSVDTTQLDPAFVGRRYDEAFLGDLPSEVDPCGEHGEFHTFVTAGPPFQSAIEVEVRGKKRGERMHYAHLWLREEEAEDPSPPPA